MPDWQFLLSISLGILKGHAMALQGLDYPHIPYSRKYK